MAKVQDWVDDQKVLGQLNFGKSDLSKQNNLTLDKEKLPCAPWYNTTLKSEMEVKQAIAQVKQLGLNPHKFVPKNWDSLAALDLILQRVLTNEKVLDAGAETYSQILMANQGDLSHDTVLL